MSRERVGLPHTGLRMPTALSDGRRHAAYVRVCLSVCMYIRQGSIMVGWLEEPDQDFVLANYKQAMNAILAKSGQCVVPYR